MLHHCVVEAFAPIEGLSMQDAGCGLRRMVLLGTSVSKGKRKALGYRTPADTLAATVALTVESTASPGR